VAGQGRPTLYTEALATEIVERLTAGEPLAKICRDAHMPAVRTVSHWKEAHPAFLADVARAREDGYDAIAVDALVIADTPVEGVSEKFEQVVIPNPDDAEGPPTTEFRLTERKVEDMLGHRKLQIDTRLKLLACWDPKRYGSRVALDHGVQDDLASKLRAARERAGLT
jgi:hypothetical protein